MRAIAERRLRLGFLLSEIARRLELRAERASDLEDLVIDSLIGQSKVLERQVSGPELLHMMQE